MGSTSRKQETRFERFHRKQHNTTPHRDYHQHSGFTTPYILPSQRLSTRSHHPPATTAANTNWKEQHNLNQYQTLQTNRQKPTDAKGRARTLLGPLRHSPLLPHHIPGHEVELTRATTPSRCGPRLRCFGGRQLRRGRGWGRGWRWRRRYRLQACWIIPPAVPPTTRRG